MWRLLGTPSVLTQAQESGKGTQHSPAQRRTAGRSQTAHMRTLPAHSPPPALVLPLLAAMDTECPAENSTGRGADSLQHALPHGFQCFFSAGTQKQDGRQTCLSTLFQDQSSSGQHAQRCTRSRILSRCVLAWKLMARVGAKALVLEPATHASQPARILPKSLRVTALCVACYMKAAAVAPKTSRASSRQAARTVAKAARAERSRSLACRDESSRLTSGPRASAPAARTACGPQLAAA